MRWRNSWGRMSPTRWVAPLVWPLAWQSKQATPRLGRTVRRSSVALNCCCGKRAQEQPQPLELLGIQDPVEQLVIILERHLLALRDVAQVGPGRQVDRRRETRAGSDSGRSKSRSKRVRSRSSCFLISSIWNLGKTMPPSGWLGWGSGIEPRREEVLFADLPGGYRGQRSQVMPPGARPARPPERACPGTSSPPGPAGRPSRSALGAALLAAP